LRLNRKPSRVIADGIVLPEIKYPSDNGWTWNTLSSGGILKISKEQQKNIVIDF